MKTRNITIFRPKWIEDKKNPEIKKKIMVPYVVKINSGVSDSHRMCESF